MRFGRIAFPLLLVGLVLGLAGFDAPPKPDPKSQQYRMGYEAGRRNERADLCSRFEKHAAVATGLLGAARMILIRAFCAAHNLAEVSRLPPDGCDGSAA
jgi:2-hydroxychromene-2-carboxylate isomerase